MCGSVDGVAMLARGAEASATTKDPDFNDVNTGPSVT